jgi:hypothetical protein
LLDELAQLILGGLLQRRHENSPDVSVRQAKRAAVSATTLGGRGGRQQVARQSHPRES